MSRALSRPCKGCKDRAERGEFGEFHELLVRRGDGVHIKPRQGPSSEDKEAVGIRGS